MLCLLVLILVLNKKDTQAVLMKAAQMGYGATGEYVFITTNLKSLFNDTVVFYELRFILLFYCRC